MYSSRVDFKDNAMNGRHGRSLPEVIKMTRLTYFRGKQLLKVTALQNWWGQYSIQLCFFS